MPTKSSFRAVNLLYLLVFCLQLSNLLFATLLPQYVRLILNEALFVFLPAYLFLRITRQPVAERVGWRWPGWKAAALALLTGAGLYPLGVVSAAVLQQVLGYTSLVTPADIIPTTALTGVLAIIAYAVMAPLCEELLFRGVIQPVYAQKGARWTVLFTGLLFILFHLSLLQGLSIILLSLALGYVYHRTRSLPASILTHFGANGLAALVLTSQVFPTGIDRVVTAAPVLIGGLVIAGLALIGLTVLTRLPAGPAPEPAAAPETETLPVHPRRLAAAWPLLAAALLWLPVVAVEFVYSRSPEALVTQPLVVEAVAWSAPQTWRYEIRNVADEVVGDATCELTTDETENSLACTSSVRAYEVQQGNSFYSSSGGSRTDRLTWRAANGALVNAEILMTLDDGTYRSETAWAQAADHIRITTQADEDEPQEITLPYSETPLAGDPALPVVHDYTWAWQLAGLTLADGEMGSVVHFRPNTWREETQDSGPVSERALVSVAGQEDVVTPAGPCTAWKVTLGRELAAWYAVDGGPVPVKFFNGVETWLLNE
ncbi:MAG TPA: type II CAAX endopeptidase family protein [Anaerolineaceae bacterium]|nr:type II CAAX endopeptidase family protein [Anaerolineaceae bacterium]